VVLAVLVRRLQRWSLALGMKVIAADSYIDKVDVKVEFLTDNPSQQQSSLNHNLFKEADFIIYTFLLKMVTSLESKRTSYHERWCRHCKLRSRRRY
jgi:VanZ family protein